MIKADGLVKEFMTASGSVKAVDDIDMQVEDGKFVALVGESGSGKSTLLSLLGALSKPNAGSFLVDDTDITRLNDHDLIRYRRDSVGFVFQNYSLVPNLSALENVMLPMEFSGMPREERKKRAAELLSQVGLDGDKQARKPARLSGGEQQRVGIARALANHPRLILADEPTGNLDSKTGQNIITLLRELSRSENTTIVAATHDLSIEEQCDRIYRIRDGKFIDNGDDAA
ncbi:MAG: ABC transporter ATP-binding protein [Thermoleophilia bacterium]|nr:ABC transporter ATP-binding protein [Thermoleophilia bacterium]